MLRDWPDCGYHMFGWDADTYRWSQAARRIGIDVAEDPDMQSRWLQCDGTWFVGVDALPTGADGSIDGVRLSGPAIDRIGPQSDLHPAQLSIIYPDYPRPRTGEGDAAFRYRVNRDAAHMDGVLADGTPRRRFLRERHDWILGLPLTETAPGASPLVVWSGSHHILQAALAGALADHDPESWPEIDITEIYTAARRTAFQTCARIPLFARPGEAMVLNPFLLHGVAPWQPEAYAPSSGRMIAYFRPESRDSAVDWIRQK